MRITNEKLKELLVGPGHIGEADFELAAKEATKQKTEVQELLVEKDLIENEQLGQLIAEDSGFPFLNLKTRKEIHKYYSLFQK